jgi:hypothetical protein
MLAVVWQERRAEVEGAEVGRMVVMYRGEVLQSKVYFVGERGRRPLVWSEKRLKTCLTLMRANIELS